MRTRMTSAQGPREERQATKPVPGCRKHAPLRDRAEQLAPDVAATELADLRRQVADLREAVRARDDFVAIAIHELRNPMTPIVAAADLALKAAQDAKGSCPPRIAVLLERLQFLVQDFVQRSTRLLDVSRVEAGHLRLELSTTDLSALARSVAQRHGPVAARAGRPVELDVEALNQHLCHQRPFRVGWGL